MVTYSFYEMDNRVRRYAETLAARGDSVEAVALRRPGQPKREIIRGVLVSRIQRRVINEQSQWLYFAKLLLFLFKSMVYLAVRQIRRPYDLVHVHSIPDYEVFAAWFPKLMGAKIILDIHDLVPELYAAKFVDGRHTWLKNLLLNIEKWSAKFADHVIVANDIWHGTLVSRSVPASKCTAILNFPDPTIFGAAGRTGDHTGEKFTILYPGTLNHHQGLDIAIRAFASVRDKMDDAEFRIYGRGPDRGALEQLITELHLERQVFVHDPLPLTEIVGVMARAQIGIVPKRSDSFGNEAFSTKTLEFMSLGVPVIVADTKIDRFYFDESFVQFFRSGEVEDLAEKMLLLRNDRALRERLAANASEFVSSNNWGVRKQVYLDLISSLTKTTRPDAGGHELGSSALACIHNNKEQKSQHV